ALARHGAAVGRRQVQQPDALPGQRQLFVAVLVAQVDDPRDPVIERQPFGRLDREAAPDRQRLGQPVEVEANRGRLAGLTLGGGRGGPALGASTGRFASLALVHPRTVSGGNLDTPARTTMGLKLNYTRSIGR